MIIQQKYVSIYETPVGPIEVVADKGSLISLSFWEEMNRIKISPNEITKKALVQFEEYFSGKRTVFDLNLNYNGYTEFQIAVWKELMDIPFGETRSYRDIAVSIRSPRAFRAVGTACGLNPFVVVVPCHRVIAANGKLGGYSAGLLRKKWLLTFESQKKEK
jgi:methylated-DNA-[protein]-cysteine S-methyltransferase